MPCTGWSPTRSSSRSSLPRPGGPAAGATTEVVVVPVHGHCMDCRHDFERADPSPACPACGSLDVATDGGDEVILEWLEYAGACSRIRRQRPSSSRRTPTRTRETSAVCLAIPGRIVEFLPGNDDQLALVDVVGVKRKINIGLMEDEDLRRRRLHPDPRRLRHVEDRRERGGRSAVDAGDDGPVVRRRAAGRRRIEHRMNASADASLLGRARLHHLRRRRRSAHACSASTAPTRAARTSRAARRRSPSNWSGRCEPGDRLLVHAGVATRAADRASRG